MRIAAAASKSGLSADTIRYYEKYGMLPPIARSADGHRRYSKENIEWLTVLFWLRQTGMPMKVMRRYAELVHSGDHTIPERKQILQDHATTLQKRREELDQCEKLLAYKLKAYTAAEQKGEAL